MFVKKVMYKCYLEFIKGKGNTMCKENHCMLLRVSASHWHVSITKALHVITAVEYHGVTPTAYSICAGAPDLYGGKRKFGIRPCSRIPGVSCHGLHEKQLLYCIVPLLLVRTLLLLLLKVPYILSCKS